MKRILATSAAALVVLAGAASAMTSVPSAYENQIKRFAPEADLSQVSSATIQHILSTINDDGDDSFVTTQAQVRSLLENLN